MLLTGRLDFQAKLQKNNRVAIPKKLRWLHKLEAGELLQIRVTPLELRDAAEEFVAEMSKDGRLTVPKLIVEVLMQEGAEELVGKILFVSISPVDTGDQNGLPNLSAALKSARA